MIFTIITDVDTKKDAPKPHEVREEIVRLLSATARGWTFVVYPPEKTEREP